jgi:hypothetical protein
LCHVSPYMPHYCAIFHFACHSFAICFFETTQYYCAVFPLATWARIGQNTEWHRCYLCSHWFSQVFKEIATGPKNYTNEYQNARITISWQTYGWVSQTNTTFCLWLDGPTFHDLLKPVTPTISKRNLSARSNCSQWLSITLHHFVTVDTSEDPKLNYKQPLILLCSLHFSLWTCLLPGIQTVNARILCNAVCNKSVLSR